MSLSQVKTLYGVHSFTFFDRTSKLPLGILKVLGSVNIALSSSFTDLFGGASRYAWASQPGTIDTQISLNAKQLENVMFKKCLGASVVENAAETGGDVSTPENGEGTSVISSSTGVATVDVKSGKTADLKDGLYVIKAVSATTVDVYCMSDVDFGKGTAKVFESDLLKITASALTITASTGVEVTGFGLELTGGDGTIGMTEGDTAYFWVRSVNAGSDEITVGASTATFEQFGCFWSAQKTAEGNFDLYVPRAQAIGLPLQLSEQAFATFDMTMKALYDSGEDCVFKARRIKAAA